MTGGETSVLLTAALTGGGCFWFLGVVCGGCAWGTHIFSPYKKLLSGSSRLSAAPADDGKKIVAVVANSSR